jgi:mutator protein MutT
MKRIQVVVVAVILHKGKYLLTRRYGPRTKLTHNKWQFPGGGLEFNETIDQCLKREVMEEVSISVKILKLIPFIHEKILGSWHGVAISFLCKPATNNLKIKLDKEASAYGWYSLDEARKLDLHHGTYQVIEAASKLKF